MRRKKKEDEIKDSDSTTMDEGKGVINEKGSKNVDLDEFDESTCSGDRYYDIVDKLNKSLQKVQLFG